MSGAEKISQDTAYLTLENISAERGGRVLFAGLSLHVRAGDLLWVTGDNGIGKTTLLRVMAGLLAPSHGQVHGTQQVSFLEYAGHATQGLSAAEDYDFWAKIYGRSDAHGLRDVGLADHEKTRTEALSTGQAKRLGLAKLALAARSVWLMDEPMAGLDMAGRDLLRATLAAHLRGGGAAVIASHTPIILNDHPAKKLVLEAA